MAAEDRAGIVVEQNAEATMRDGIVLKPTGNLFRRGHRIGLDISSSDFPNFDRNHNTGGDDYREATLRTAQQQIFHDAARPSRVILPVIP